MDYYSLIASLLANVADYAGNRRAGRAAAQAAGTASQELQMAEMLRTLANNQAFREMVASTAPGRIYSPERQGQYGRAASLADFPLQELGRSDIQTGREGLRRALIRGAEMPSMARTRAAGGLERAGIMRQYGREGLERNEALQNYIGAMRPSQQAAINAALQQGSEYSAIAEALRTGALLSQLQGNAPAAQPSLAHVGRISETPAQQAMAANLQRELGLESLTQDLQGLTTGTGEFFNLADAPNMKKRKK